MNRPDYIQDSNVLSARFQRRDVYGAWKQYPDWISDTAPERAYTANQVYWEVKYQNSPQFCLSCLGVDML